MKILSISMALIALEVLFWLILGKLVYNTVIPRNVRLSEAPSFSVPALLYDHKCAGSIAYQKLAIEFLERERQ